MKPDDEQKKPEEGKEPEPQQEQAQEQKAPEEQPQPQQEQIQEQEQVQKQDAEQQSGSDSAEQPLEAEQDSEPSQEPIQEPEQEPEQNPGQDVPPETPLGDPEQPKKKKRKLGDRIRSVLIVIFAAIFCISAFMLIKDYVDRRQAEADFEDLSNRVHVTMPPLIPVESQDPAADPEASAEPGEDPAPRPSFSVPGKELPFKGIPDLVKQQLDAYQELHEENSDLLGWITIEGTGVDYPVMYTPRDTEFYLRKNFEKEYSNAGTPFADGTCYDGGLNWIIYGHNLRSGEMFAPILQYRSKSFWEEHPTIRFDTLDELGEYEIIAAINTRVYTAADTDVFKYYNYQDISDPEKYEEFVTNCKEMSLYDTGVTAEYGDQLITLSTCGYTYTTNLRFVVVAKLVSSVTAED